MNTGPTDLASELSVLFAIGLQYAKGVKYQSPRVVNVSERTLGLPQPPTGYPNAVNDFIRRAGGVNPLIYHFGRRKTLKPFDHSVTVWALVVSFLSKRIRGSASQKVELRKLKVDKKEDFYSPLSTFHSLGQRPPPARLSIGPVSR